MSVVVDRALFARVCEPLLRRILVPLREAALQAGVLLPGDVGTAGAEALLRAEVQRAAGGGSGGATEVGGVEAEAGAAGAAGAAFWPDDSGPSAGKVSELRRAQQAGRVGARGRQAQGRRDRAAFASATSAASAASARGGATAASTAWSGHSGHGGGSGAAARMLAFPVGRAVDTVVLVGGATRMPAVRDLLRGLLEAEPRRTVDPMEAVALGAAVAAGMADGDAGVAGLDVMDPFQAALLRYLAREEQESKDKAKAKAKAKAEAGVKVESGAGGPGSDGVGLGPV